MRGSAGVMMLVGIFAIVNGFVLRNYEVLPYLSAMLIVNFLIGLVINPKYAPSVLIAKGFIEDQSPLYIGAIQKQFAWSLGLVLTTVIFILSLFLLQDPSYFNSVCILCVICFLFLYLETAFGVCVGCSLYHYSLKIGLLKEPKERPNCMGDACSLDR